LDIACSISRSAPATRDLWEGEAPAEPMIWGNTRLDLSLALHSSQLNTTAPEEAELE